MNGGFLHLFIFHYKNHFKNDQFRVPWYATYSVASQKYFKNTETNLFTPLHINVCVNIEQKYVSLLHGEIATCPF